MNDSNKFFVRIVLPPGTFLTEVGIEFVGMFLFLLFLFVLTYLGVFEVFLLFMFRRQLIKLA